MKTLIIGILSFLSGILTAILAAEMLRDFIQFLYAFSTQDAVDFIGLDLGLMINFWYYFGFGIWFYFLFTLPKDFSISKKLKNYTFSFVLFFLSIILISFLDAHLKIWSCTACTGGIRPTHFHEINYSFILSFSALLATLPFLFSKLKKQRNKKVKTKVY